MSSILKRRHLGGLANATEITVFVCEAPVIQQKIILLIYGTDTKGSTDEI